MYLQLIASAERVLPARLSRYITEFVHAGEQYDVHPLLLAAVCDRESLGGEYLRPKGPAGVGDGGHGRGLMQIDDRYHEEFVARVLPDGRYAWQDPLENICYGAELLSRNITHFRQPVLRLSPRLALACGIAAYNCGVGGVSRGLNSVSINASTKDRLIAVDSRTTGHDYSSDVLRRYGEFLVLAQIRS